MKKYVRGFHFVGATLRDKSAVPADGKWLDYAGKCVMCKSGLHASRHPFDALPYAPGATLCLVECDDIAEEQVDKLVCAKRRIIARFDATELLWQMARWSALQVIHLWDAPQVVHDYLTTGDESLRAAARAASWTAAMAAARDASGAAWMAAARDASGAAWMAASGADARAAARDAAMAASTAASTAAAMDAAWDAQRQHFAALVTAKFVELGVVV